MPLRDAAPVGAPCWIDLSTSDPDRSRAFYEDIFGWTSESAPEFGGYINFATDGVPVAGGMGHGDQEGLPEAWSIYLASADIDATLAEVAPAGGTVEMPAMDVMDLGRMGFVIDPGGARVGVWQPGVHKGFGVLDEVNSPSWFELHTRAHEASVAFYRDVFGWETFAVGDTDEFRYTTLGEGDGQLAGVMDAAAFLPEGTPALWSVYFRVADADATVARAVELGSTVEDQPEDTPYGRLATLHDPLGARFKLRQI